MPFLRTDASSEILKNHARMAMFRDSENPLFLNVIAFDPREGFTGVTAIMEEDMDADDLFRAIDAGKLPADGSITIAHVGLIDAWVGQAMTEPDPDAKTETPYREFIRDEIDDETFRMFSDMPWLRREIEVLNHHCTGNIQARREVAQALPIMALHLIGRPDIETAIDGGSRQDLVLAIQESFGIPGRDMKKMLKVENMASRSIGDPDGRESSGLLARSFDKGRLARKFGILNSHQFPRDLENAAQASLYIDQLSRLSGSMEVGMSPYVRILKRVAADAWGEAREALPSSVPQEEKDYLKRLDLAISTAMLVGVVSERAPDLMARVNRTAEAVWKDDPIDPQDGETLSQYLKMTDILATYQARNSVLEVIGSEVTLKNIREFSTRWHHIQQTMDNDMLSTSSDIEWAPVLGQANIGENLRVRELCSSSELKRQGEQEQHCVGGYASNILNVEHDRATMIFSIEKRSPSDDWNILSTIEIGGRFSPAIKRLKTQDEVSWTNRQHKARRNHSPCMAAESGAEALIDILKQIPPADFKSYLSSIRSNTTSLRDTLSRTVLRMKANITNPEVAETSLSVHAEILPKQLRDLDWKGWDERIRRHEETSDIELPMGSLIDRLAKRAERLELEMKEADAALSTSEPEV